MEGQEILLVNEIGTKVLLGSDQRGRIVSVNIGENASVKYEVAWFDRGERKSDWFTTSEIDVIEMDDPPRCIGFVR